jgi:hypothetical protein
VRSSRANSILPRGYPAGVERLEPRRRRKQDDEAGSGHRARDARDPEGQPRTEREHRHEGRRRHASRQPVEPGPPGHLIISSHCTEGLRQALCPVEDATARKRGEPVELAAIGILAKGHAEDGNPTRPSASHGF